MAKLNLLTSTADYTLVENAQLLYQALEGGLGMTRLDYIDDVEKRITVSWSCDATEYAYLQEFLRQNVADDCVPFDIDLIVGTHLVVEYSARFVPETFELTGVDGYTFHCKAEIVAIPQTLDNDWPEEWLDFDIGIRVDKSQYSITPGNESIMTKHDGGVSHARRSYFNSAYKASVSWICKDDQFSLIMQAYRAHTAAGGKPFTIDLFVHTPELVKHRALIIPGSFTLTSHAGKTFIVNAQLEVESKPWMGTFTPHLTSDPVPTPSIIGWLSPVDNESGTAAQSNEGSMLDMYFNYNDGLDILLYAGVVGYVAQSVVWSIDWTGDPGAEPTLTPLTGGKIRVTIPNQSEFFPAYFVEGIATITATVNGAASNAIEVAWSDGFYGPLAWGPVP